LESAVSLLHAAVFKEGVAIMANSITGVAGSVTVGDGPTINIYEWSGDFGRDVYDDSHFDSDKSNARKKVAGMAQLTGRCVGYAQTGTTPGIGAMATEHDVTGGTFELMADATTSDIGYSFTGLIADLTVDVVKVDLVHVSFSFQSQGAVIAKV
jgi:hypothetical protein